MQIIQAEKLTLNGGQCIEKHSVRQQSPSPPRRRTLFAKARFTKETSGRFFESLLFCVINSKTISISMCQDEEEKQRHQATTNRREKKQDTKQSAGTKVLAVPERERHEIMQRGNVNYKRKSNEWCCRQMFVAYCSHYFPFAMRESSMTQNYFDVEVERKLARSLAHGY